MPVKKEKQLKKLQKEFFKNWHDDFGDNTVIVKFAWDGGYLSAACTNPYSFIRKFEEVKKMSVDKKIRMKYFIKDYTKKKEH